MAIIGYEYRMDGGSWIDVGLPDPLTFTVEGLDPATEYDFEIRGYDSEGNRTAISNIATASTLGIDAFDPLIWLRPEELEAAYEEDDDIVLWSDVSGYDHHGTSGAGDAPLFKPAVINDRGGAYFFNDASTVQTMVLGSTSPWVDDVAEIIAVLKMDADPPGNSLWSGLWEFTADGVATAGMYPRSDGEILEAFGTNGNAKAVGDPGTSLDQPHIYTVFSQQDDFGAYINRSLVFSDSSHDFAFSSSPQLGKSNEQIISTPRMRGHIFELMLWGRKLSTEEREAVWTYLEEKYDL